jgi:hypothetical protein
MRVCKRKDPTLYPLRKATMDTICRRCGMYIIAGEKYFDGGTCRWFHQECARRESRLREEARREESG